jgi:hypothetical protein
LAGPLDVYLRSWLLASLPSSVQGSPKVDTRANHLWWESVNVHRPNSLASCQPHLHHCTSWRAASSRALKGLLLGAAQRRVCTLQVQDRQSLVWWNASCDIVACDAVQNESRTNLPPGVTEHPAFRNKPQVLRLLSNSESAYTWIFS